MFREWFFKRDVFTQLIGVEDGHGQATITKKPVDELRQPWSGWIRADVYAFRPILDHELSSVLEKAAHTPGIPDPAGRPLFHLDKKRSADQKVQWIATFLHQEPSEVNGRTAVEHLWYRVFWEQVDKELLITRVDELSVLGGADSMPLRVALVDDYRTIDGVSIPHRVRTFMFANPSGLLGAELVASEVKVNDGVVMPTQFQIPAGTSVTDELTGKRYRQPVDEPKSHQNLPKTPTGNSENTTINPDIPAEGKSIDKEKLLNELRERDRKFSRRTVELERTWDTLTSPRGEAAQYRHNSIRFGQADPGIPEGLPEDYQQPHRIRYIWTGQNFESTLEILVDLETEIHPAHGKLESRSIESDCFNYYRFWNRDLEIFSHSSDIAKLGGGKKAWEYLLPSGFGFTPSILSVSNAVEVQDGYVLKGLISLPSATIGNRKNCFEIHLDKEMILRKAVIQYHVYDFVIVTTGRSEFENTPPLAKHAAVSIYHIGQDEKRLGDVGNYKYELIALSEKLNKAEYDLRVNFEIPKETKLATGLNLVEVNLDGLPGVKQIERDVPAPRPEVTPRDSRENESDQTRVADPNPAGIDHGNARSVVEAYVAAALAGDRKTVQSLTGGNPQETEQLAKTIDSLILSLSKLDSLATKTVFVNSPDCPSKGFALTETLKWEHRTNPSADRIDVRLRFELSRSDQGWYVTEIGIETEERANELLPKFLEDNPTAISVLPQGSTEKASGGNIKTLVLDCEEIYDLHGVVGLTQLEELYINQFIHPTTDFRILKDMPHLRKLIFSKWSGLSSDEIATITESLPGVEVVEEEIQLDRKKARFVVEAYIALALASDVAKAAALAKNSPADPKRIAEIPKYLNVQRLKIQTVYINDPANPTRALATSVAVKLGEEHKNPDGRRDGFMVFTLEFIDEEWFVFDIDFETESGAEKELNKFLKANPNSIGIPPQSHSLSR
jgi:hypothetical protein